MDFNLSRLFSSDAPQGQIPPELQDIVANNIGTNFNTNFGVYMPRNTQIAPDYNDASYFTPASSGFVNSATNKNIAHINTDYLPKGSKFSGTYPIMGTVAHEAAHTAQPGPGQHNYGAMKDLKYEHYDYRTDYPPAEEILASLREREAGMAAGKTVWQTDEGKETLSRMQSLNPTMSKAGTKRYMDQRLFPEHQVMHEWNPAETTQLKPSWYDKHVDVVRNLFK